MKKERKKNKENKEEIKRKGKSSSSGDNDESASDSPTQSLGGGTIINANVLSPFLTNPANCVHPYKKSARMSAPGGALRAFALARAHWTCCGVNCANSCSPTGVFIALYTLLNTSRKLRGAPGWPGAGGALVRRGGVRVTSHGNACTSCDAGPAG